MTLVPVETYPQVRQLLRATAASIADGEIEEAGAVATDRIDARVPGASATPSGPLLERYQRAARYLTASILAPRMRGGQEDVTSFRTTDSTVTMGQRDWDQWREEYERLAWEILGVTEVEPPMHGSVFRVSRSRRGRASW